MTNFVPGHCYYDAHDGGKSPITFKCRKSILFGMLLAPLNKTIFDRSLPCAEAGARSDAWVDCTEQVKRSEAMKNCTECPLTNITKDMVGTIIAYPGSRGMSAPHFLYAYDNGMAYLMSLDGMDVVFNRRLTQCYPLQKMYTDVANRAVSSDPLQSSVFDGLFTWLKKTPQYDRFLSVAKLVPEEDREDMVKLFELMSYSGVTAETFEAEVKKLYDALPADAKEGVPIYTAVLEAYKTPAATYSKIEQEIMRMTDFKYKSPAEAWKAVGGNKPYPKTLKDVSLAAPRTPAQVIEDTLGLFNRNAERYWFDEICLKLGTFYDFNTEWEKGLADYVAKFPEYNVELLDFIKEGNKEDVFKKLLGVDALDPKDPFRAWMQNPPLILQELVKKTPGLSYAHALYNYYKQLQACEEVMETHV